MKKLLLASLLLSIAFFSCEKGESEKEKDIPCPIIDVALIPQIVKDSFAVKYPTDSVIKWFFKDEANYCAYFKSGAEEELVEFTEEGVFVKDNDEMDSDEDNDNHEGNHEEEDDDDDDSTYINPKTGLVIKHCECEIGDKKEEDDDN